MTGSHKRPADRAEPDAAAQDQSVVDTVLDLTVNDPDLSERQKSLVLAALESGEAVAAELDDNAPTEPGRRAAAGASATAQIEAEPVGAFLSSITVSGFRGIGDKAQLNLQPGPGLTVVAGRNGSGKSSFAEALEYALTGDSYRWTGKKAPFWKDSWRNLHQNRVAALRIELAEEGAGRTEIGVDWSTGGKLDEHEVWTQRSGAQRAAGLGSLGWAKALELYRPILSYDELGHRLDGTPTDLYRSIAGILGLEQIADGIDRLSDVTKRLKAPADAAAAAKAELKQLLGSAKDERAQLVYAEVKKYKPDLELVSKIATGVSAPDQLGAQLRTLSELTVPDREPVEQAAGVLLAAVEKVASIGGIAPTLADARRNLLEQALKLHAEHEDQSCPVCGVGVLDDSWRERVVAQLAAEQEELAAIRAVHQELTEARLAARAQVDAPEIPAGGDALGLAGLAGARAVLDAWRGAPISDVELAQHLTSHVAQVIEVLTRLREAAAAQLSGRDDSWRELAGRIAAWVELKRAAEAVSADLRDAKAALDWLKQNAEKLHNKRVEPLSDEARKIWAKLRQDSSIDLDAITLSGQRTRGKVNLSATVDGVPTPALPVMSQGELNAIALALFLPRATMSASPLRFVVLDDPVQAMDPAKVDGLTEVLTEYAKDRQVIVFTHDDRLAESVRRTAPGARIIQVERGVGSTVEVTECQSPARRYIKDARDLLADDNVPTAVLNKTIPGYARLAVEAAAHEVYFRRRLTGGDSRREVEEAWTDALRTRQRVALALADGNLGKWSSVGHRQRTLTLCGNGVHRGIKAGVRNALDDLGKTVDDLLGAQP